MLSGEQSLDVPYNSAHSLQDKLGTINIKAETHLPEISSLQSRGGGVL